MPSAQKSLNSFAVEMIRVLALLTMIKQKATVFDKMQRAEQVQAQVDAAEERLAQVQKV